MVKTKETGISDPIGVPRNSTNQIEPLPPHEACWKGICSFVDNLGKNIGKLFQNKREEEEQKKVLLDKRRLEFENEKLRLNLSDEVAKVKKLEHEKELMSSELSNLRLFNEQIEESHKHKIRSGKEALDRLLNDTEKRREEDRAFLLQIFEKHEMQTKQFEVLHTQHRQLAASYQELVNEYRTLEQTNREIVVRLHGLEDKNQDLIRSRCTNNGRYCNTAEEEEKIREQGLQNDIDVLPNF